MNWQNKVLIGLAVSTILSWTLAVFMRQTPTGQILFDIGNILSMILSSFGMYLFLSALQNAVLNQNGPTRHHIDDIQINLKHTHDHYFHDNRLNVVEGVEQTDFRPDGSSTTTRYIKKWN